MSKMRVLYIAFFAVLVVGFFLIMSFIIPGFTNPVIPPISTVRPFSFTNQDGKKINNATIDNKLWQSNIFSPPARAFVPA
jgi:protein SCO1/2